MTRVILDNFQAATSLLFLLGHLLKPFSIFFFVHFKKSSSGGPGQAQCAAVNIHRPDIIAPAHRDLSSLVQIVLNFYGYF